MNATDIGSGFLSWVSGTSYKVPHQPPPKPPPPPVPRDMVVHTSDGENDVTIHLTSEGVIVDVFDDDGNVISTGYLMIDDLVEITH